MLPNRLGARQQGSLTISAQASVLSADAHQISINTRQDFGNMPIRLKHTYVLAALLATVPVVTPAQDIAITSYPAVAPGSGGPNAITRGSDGALWFTLGSGSIGRMTSAGAFTSYSIPTANSAPMGIAAGPDGALWFTESAANQIGRITPTAGVVTEYPVPTANSSPWGITAGPDGNLWFTEYNGD